MIVEIRNSSYLFIICVCIRRYLNVTLLARLFPSTIYTNEQNLNFSRFTRISMKCVQVFTIQTLTYTHTHTYAQHDFCSLTSSFKRHIRMLQCECCAISAAHIPMEMLFEMTSTRFDKSFKITDLSVVYSVKIIRNGYVQRHQNDNE